MEVRGIAGGVTVVDDFGHHPTAIAQTLGGLRERGTIKQGWYADIVVFDPKKVQDHATFEKPQQYATGVTDVFVNGVQVIKNGEHTGATPGRFIKGPGYGKKLR